MNNRRSITLSLFTALDLILGLSVAAVLWAVWSGAASGLPDFLDFVRLWRPDQVLTNTIIAIAAVVVFSAIVYLLSLRVRQEKRPLVTIYLIAMAACLPPAGMGGGANVESSAALGIGLFVAVAFVAPLLVFLAEFIAGGIAKTLANLAERFEAHGAAGRFFALASLFRPSDPQLLRRHAFAEFMAGNYRRVIPILERLRSRGEQDQILLDRLENAYRQERQWEPDVDILNELLRGHPNDPKYLRLQAQAFEQLERWEDALQAREACLEARNPAQLEEVARLALRAGRVDRALDHARTLREFEGKPYKRTLEIYAEVLAAAPDALDVMEEMAEMQVRLENEARAVALWERVLEHDPKRSATRRRLIDYFQRAGQLDQEETHLRPLIEMEPGDSEALLRLAENLAEQKRPDDAWGILQLGMTRFSGDYRFAFESSRHSLGAGNLPAAETALKQAEAVAGKAEISRLGALRRRLESEKVNRELRQLRHLIQQQPDDPQPRYKLIDRLARMEDWASVRNEFDILLNMRPELRPQVIEHLRRLIAQTEQNYLLQDYLADLLFADRDFTDVLSIYEHMANQSIHGEQTLMEGCRKILRAAPDFAPAIGRLGTMLCNTQQWEPSIEANARYLELTEGFEPEKVRELYRANLALGRIPEAESYAHPLLAEDPQNTELRIQLINGYEELQRFEDAVRLAAECVEVAPNSSAFRRRLDMLTLKRKRQRAEELEKELAEQPENPERQFELADLYEQFQEYDSSIAHFQRAARSDTLRNISTARLGHGLALRGMFDLASETLAQVHLDNRNADEQEDLKSLLYESGMLFEEEGLSQRALSVYKAIFRVDASFRDIVSRLSRYRS